MKTGLSNKNKFIALIASFLFSFIILANQYYENADIIGIYEGFFLQVFLIPFIVILILLCLYLKFQKEALIPFLWVLPLNIIYLYLAYNASTGAYNVGWDGMALFVFPFFLYIYMGIFLVVFVLVKFTIYLKER